MWASNGKANVYVNEVGSYIMNLSLNKDGKKNWEQLKDVILKVAYQYFSAYVGGHQMIRFPCYMLVWWRIQVFKLAKDKKEKALALYQYQRMVREKKGQYYQMQEKRKDEYFNSNQS